MSAEENKVILRHALDDVWNHGNLRAGEELAAPAFVVHSNTPGLAPNPGI